jgi:hypothetical protein
MTRTRTRTPILGYMYNKYYLTRNIITGDMTRTRTRTPIPGYKIDTTSLGI